MKVTVLGTGTSQGIPVIGCQCEVCRSSDPRDNRLRTSLLVETENASITVDIGPDFRQQMLRFHNGGLDAVLMTHEHNDHMAGLDDIRPYNFLYHRNFPLYGLPRVLDDIRRRFSYVFAADKYPGSPSVILKEIEAWDEVIIGDLTARALPVHHGTLDILGYSFGDVAYLTDVKWLDDQVIDYLYGVKVLILNALHHTSHHSHLNLEEAMRLIEKINPRNAYLTHLSHHMGLHEKVNQELPSNVKLAFDGLTLSV